MKAGIALIMSKLWKTMCTKATKYLVNKSMSNEINQ